MHAQQIVVKDSALPMRARSAVEDETSLASRHAPHSIMSVLQPARPPEPKNARVIRRFDLDVPAGEPPPVVAAPAPCAAKPARPHVRNRQEARAQRNKSLLAAAGLA